MMDMLWRMDTYSFVRVENFYQIERIVERDDDDDNQAAKKKNSS